MIEQKAKDEGLPLTVETCPHYLCLEAERIDDGNTSGQMRAADSTPRKPQRTLGAPFKAVSSTLSLQTTRLASHPSRALTTVTLRKLGEASARFS